MNFAVITAGPEQHEDRVPILAGREDVEHAVALYRQALVLLNEAEGLGLAGSMGSFAEDELGAAKSILAYYERWLNQPGGFVVVGFAVEEDDPESPAILERQRQSNAAIGASDFAPSGDLDNVLGADG